ncbi:conserved hypothetical protein [Parvibaculum lavamentivorans DS-1]|uniref:DUF2066 domain-containing protein n=1 Tax=Parvibaculum lavamentivorans (strain DS-1 / DSM 13023 / NCIMB 13966) TaxID=402881 RepID=A7HYF1_PARL1|nr:DUF2066 domain-containing protein [Parvibaculum lavamentivorans]ABS64934.1 conserved hypothetical protein [Parvibaculum lavamentivorans DS-1]
MFADFRLWRAAAVVFAVAGFFAQPAAAADVFTVRGIHVDKTAESATAARTAAQAEGQRLALTEMMMKLTLPEDWASLPPVDDATAQRAVRGFQVASEKTSSTRYIAEMIVSFQPEAVRRLLRGANVPFGETQARPALLLAVLNRDGRKLLWEEQNAWREAWAALEPADELTPLILPLGDIMEINSLSAEQASTGEEAALASLAANYGTSETVVAEATVEGETLKVTVRRIGGPAASEPVSGTYAREGRDEAATMQAAAADMLNALAVAWKRQIIVRDGRLSTLAAQAIFMNLNEWETIRKGLTSTPLVQNMEVAGISSRGAEIRISHKGTAEMLALSLAQQNVTLTDAVAETGAPADGSTGRTPRWRLGVRQ